MITRTDANGFKVSLSDKLYMCCCSWPEIQSASLQEIYYEPLRIIVSESHFEPGFVTVTPNFEEERVWYCGIRRDWIQEHNFEEGKDTTTWQKIRERHYP